MYLPMPTSQDPTHPHKFEWYPADNLFLQLPVCQQSKSPAVQKPSLQNAHTAKKYLKVLYIPSYN